jgi:hypothetical protein
MSAGWRKWEIYIMEVKSFLKKIVNYKKCLKGGRDGRKEKRRDSKQ